jgi:hypothetical protein
VPTLIAPTKHAPSLYHQILDQKRKRLYGALLNLARKICTQKVQKASSQRPFIGESNRRINRRCESHAF